VEGNDYLEFWIFSELRNRLEEKGYGDKEITKGLISLLDSKTLQNAKNIIRAQTKEEFDFLTNFVENKIKELERIIF